MTLVVQREELPYQYVVVEGTVVDVTKPGPTDVREAIAIRDLGGWFSADYSGEVDSN